VIDFSSQPPAPLSSKTSSYTMVSGQNERMAGSVPVKSASFAENIAEIDGENTSTPEEDSSFGLSDMIDIINPLQHIPIVSNLYQSATGDTIGSVAMIVGGAIFGGPLGALTSAGLVAYKAASHNAENHNLEFNTENNVSLADRRNGFRPYNT
jgi:hypothetical protein